MDRPGVQTNNVGLNDLEEIVLHKVQQRTPPRMNEDTYIAKAFKYHDLSGSGVCDFARFKQALLPFTSGVSAQNLQAIFERYTGGSDLLNYKAFSVDFVSGVRRLPADAEGPGELEESVDHTLARMKDFLYSQGPRAIVALAVAFRDADVQCTRSLQYEVFVDTIVGFFAETGCPVSAEQADGLFGAFRQVYAPQMIAYDELFVALKEEPSAERRASTRAAFRRLDQHSEGLVDLNVMEAVFNAGRHPQVSEGTRDAPEVLAEFLDTMRDLVSFRRGQRSYPTNLVAWEEFEDYYKFVSGCFPSDAAFCGTLQRVWDLDKSPDVAIEARKAMAAPAAGIPAKARAGLHHWQQDTLPAARTFHMSQVDMAAYLKIASSALERMRQGIAAKGLRKAVDVVEAFYSVDDDVDDLLDVYEFRRACQQAGLGFHTEEEQAIFQACGEAHTTAPGGQRPTKLRLPKFLELLHGPLPATRLVAVERAFAALGGDPADEGSAITPGAMKEHLNVDAHPLVARGELDPASVLSEFLDTFSLLAHVRGGCEGGLVRFADMVAYYKVVSSTIVNDAYFDLLMHRLWNLPVGPEKEGEAEDRPQLSSPRRVVPAPEVSPMAEPRPPAFTGPSAYATEPEAPTEVHRRFMRKPLEPTDLAQAAGPVSAITKSNIVFNESRSSELDAVISRLREAISRRGMRGWKSIVEHFRKYDSRKNGAVMRLDWERMQKSLGLGLAPDEREAVFKGLSQGRRDGAMDYLACLHLLKGNLGRSQLELVQQLFDSLKEPSEDNVVLALTMKDCFDARNTPSCMLGKKNVAQAQAEFCEAVDYFAGASEAYSPEGFTDFFCMAASMCEDEDEFRLMTTAAFGFTTARGG